MKTPNFPRPLVMILFVTVLIGSCSILQPPVTEEPVAIELEPVEVVAPEPRVLRPTEKKVHDLLHTRLDVSFDWQARHLLGTAELTLRPWFYPSDRLILDAKGMDIHKVIMLDSVLTELPFEYDGEYLDIDLKRKYSRVEKFTIRIDYTAKPDEYGAEGSAAITDAKGLYFINPDSSEVNKPTQVWTQGQTEASSVWFPTIDTPAERMTQELFITVRKEFQTLSNGTLVYSNFNDDNTRTDYWKMDLAHPPYLTMMAAGDFIIAHDSWQNSEGKEIPVNYYMEPEYADYAYGIFGNTPEMMTFYSELLGFDYPWDKFSQIIVRDYVSGAMENTTAVIHGEFLNETDRELLDYNYEDVIAHELFHHWFGDLVTCESWSHLPLNESFATYGEYLWAEYKYGVEEAEYRSWESEAGYFNEARFKRLPLIRFDYDDKEEMFDAHSYNKGGRILHMLRNTVGDDAFFASLNYYLEKNAFQDAETDNLRLAFEEVTGLDMNWFFDQWFYGAGHPEITVSYFFDEAAGEAQMILTQTQDLETSPVFELPLDVMVYHGDEVSYHQITMSEQEQLFRFPYAEEPTLIIIDPAKASLVQWNDQKPDDWWAIQYNKAETFRDRLQALEEATDDLSADDYPLLEKALNDSHWYLRQFAIERIAESDSLSRKAQVTLRAMADNEPKTSTRAEAIRALAAMAPESLSAAQLLAGINEERSYFINAASLEALSFIDLDLAIAEAGKLEESKSADVLAAVATVYTRSKQPTHHAFFRNQIMNGSSFRQFSMIQQYAAYMEVMPESEIETALNLIEEISSEAKSWWVNIAAYRLLNQMRSQINTAHPNEGDHPLVARESQLRQQLLEGETNSNLRSLLQQ